MKMGTCNIIIINYYCFNLVRILYTNLQGLYKYDSLNLNK